jgi:hypothetical protein
VGLVDVCELLQINIIIYILYYLFINYYLQIVEVCSNSGITTRLARNSTQFIFLQKSRVRYPIKLIIFSIHLILPAALGPGVYSACSRNEYQNRRMLFLGSRARPVRRADDLTAICDPIVYPM